MTLLRICRSPSFVLLALLFPVASSWASDQIGTVTQIEGDVKFFTHPSKVLQKRGGTHALFEGEYYLVETAKVGDPVAQGNIVQSPPGGLARVVFENGDQLNIGPQTAMRIFWNRDTRDASTRVELSYGKLRGVVEKGGPRSHMVIRTKSVVMGVRGTDFFIADGGAGGGSEVSVIRGAVEVTPRTPSAKPLEVKQGFTAGIPEARTAGAPDKATGPVKGEDLPPTPVGVEIRGTTQEELQGIQRASTITKKADHVSPAVQQLEQKAVLTALNDIQAYDPKLYTQLENRKSVSPDEINGAVVQERLKEAPRAPPTRKPFKSEIDDLEQGAYEKYFKFQN